MDITMCNNDECYCKETCLRWRAYPNRLWQSYSTFGVENNEECMYYIEVLDNDDVTPLPTGKTSEGSPEDK
jgi:hypothetical protein